MLLMKYDVNWNNFTKFTHDCAISTPAKDAERIPFNQLQIKYWFLVFLIETRGFVITTANVHNLLWIILMPFLEPYAKFDECK